MITSRTLLPKLAGLLTIATLAVSCGEPRADKPQASENQTAEPPCVPLRLGGSVEVELAITVFNTPDSRCFELEVEKPSYIEVTGQEAGLELTLELMSSDGKTVLSTADSPTGRHGRETLRAVAEVAGVYRLEVKGWGDRGQRALSTVRRMTERPPTGADRERVVRWNAALSASAKADGLVKRCGGALEVRDVALRELGRLHDVWTDLEDLDWAVWAQQAIAACWRSAGDLVAAERELAVAEALAKDLGNLRLFGDIEWERGFLHEARGMLAAAADSFSKVEELRRRDGDSLKEGTALVELARVEMARGKLAAARSLYDRAIVLRELQGDDVRRKLTLKLRAELSRRESDLNRALEDVRVGLAIPQPAAPTPQMEWLQVQSELYNTQGVLLAENGSAQEAIAAYERSSELLDDAVQHLLNASPDAEVTQLRCDQGLVMYNLSGVFLGIDDSRGARATLENAEKLVQDSSCPYPQSLIQTNLGELAIRERDHEEAIRRFGIAIARAGDARNTPALAVALAGYGSCLRRMGRWQEAVPELERAREAAGRAENPRLSALILAELGDAYRRSKATAKARAILAEAQRLVEAHDTLDTEAKALVWGRVAELSLEEGRLEDAWSASDRAIEVDELDRSKLRDPTLRALFLGMRRYRFEVALGILAEFQRKTPGSQFAERAFAISEQARARVLREMLAQGNTLPRTLASIRAVLPDDIVLLEYFMGERDAYLFSISVSELRFVTLPSGAAQLAAAAKAFRSTVQRSSPTSGGEIAKAGFQLYQQLLQPVQAQLDKADRVIIVADGDLFALPFEALVHREVRGGWIPLAELSYILLRWQVNYLPSASILVDLAETLTTNGTRAKWDLVAFANPDVVGRVFLALPHSGEEATEIATFFPSNRVRVLQGEQATEAAVRKHVGGAAILHFATHAVVDEEDATKSGLVLTRRAVARHPSEDGLMTLGEISEMRLVADLVVLSACSTARGEAIRGEGLVGLWRAFLLAGAQRQVLTLWPVGDVLSREFMTAFYETLAKDHRAPSEALWLAKRQLVSAERPPSEWAPFVLLGRVDSAARAKVEAAEP